MNGYVKYSDEQIDEQNKNLDELEKAIERLKVTGSNINEELKYQDKELDFFIS